MTMKQMFLLLILSVTFVTCAQKPLPYQVGYTTKDHIGDAQTIAAWLERPLDILGTTITMSGYWISIPSQFTISSAVPMLSIPGWDPENAYDMQQAATGGYDHLYQGMANALSKQGGGKLHAVRLGWEMNGNWYPWSVGGPSGKNQTHANYIATFRRMADIFRKTVPGVKIEWCMDWAYATYGISGTPMDYWPGKEYVDIISSDVYEKDLGKDWNYAMSGGTYNLNWLVNWARTQGTKIALSEWGAYGDDAKYVSDAISWMNSLGNMFDYTVYSQYAPADQVVNKGENPNEQAVWIQQWNNTYYKPPQQNL